jgi:hypothetical protein
MLAATLPRFAKLLRLDLPTLRRRGLFLLGGIVVGLLAVFMAKAADVVQALF